MVAQPSTLFLLGPKPPAGPKWRHPRSGDAAGWAGGCWLGGGAGWPALGRKAAYGAGCGCYVLGLSQAGRSSVQLHAMAVPSLSGCMAAASASSAGSAGTSGSHGGPSGKHT